MATLSLDSIERIEQSLTEDQDGKNEFQFKIDELQTAIDQTQENFDFHSEKLAFFENYTEFVRDIASAYWSIYRLIYGSAFATEVLAEGTFPTNTEEFAHTDLLRFQQNPDFEKQWFPYDYAGLSVRKGAYFEPTINTPSFYGYELSQLEVIIPPDPLPQDVPAHWTEPLVGILPMLNSISQLLAENEPDRSDLLNILKATFDVSVSQVSTWSTNLSSNMGAHFPGKIVVLPGLVSAISSMNSSTIEANYNSWATQISTYDIYQEMKYFIDATYSVFNRGYSRMGGQFELMRASELSLATLQEEMDSLQFYTQTTYDLDIS